MADAIEQRLGWAFLLNSPSSVTPSELLLRRFDMLPKQLWVACTLCSHRRCNFLWSACF
ncbi:hypothetical protein [Enterobacter phage 03_vB_Eclo_IJM]|nr:hypothetical protein [Enterobacter phage 03_vB_Eclo_IJM]